MRYGVVVAVVIVEARPQIEFYSNKNRFCSQTELNQRIAMNRLLINMRFFIIAVEPLFIYNIYMCVWMKCVCVGEVSSVAFVQLLWNCSVLLVFIWVGLTWTDLPIRQFVTLHIENVIKFGIFSTFHFILNISLRTQIFCETEKQNFTNDDDDDADSSLVDTRLPPHTRTHALVHRK